MNIKKIHAYGVSINNHTFSDPTVGFLGRSPSSYYGRTNKYWSHFNLKYVNYGDECGYKAYYPMWF